MHLPRARYIFQWITASDSIIILQDVSYFTINIVMTIIKATMCNNARCPQEKQMNVMYTCNGAREMSTEYYNYGLVPRLSPR